MNPQMISGNDALLITNPTNIRYLTGFVGAAPEEREAYLLIFADQAYLFTNRLYREQAKAIGLLNCYIVKLLKTKNQLKIVEISRENPLSEELAKLTSQLGIKTLGFEETDLTVSELTKLKKELNGVKLIPTQGRAEELRMIKRDDEIEYIRKAAKLTDQCFDYILGKLKPGLTEVEIAWEIESYIRIRGAGLAFSPIVAFGSNTSQPHYDPKRSDLLRLKSPTLQNQDIILLDFGAKVNGYCSDMTRVIFIGKPKDEWVRTYEAVLDAQQAALKYLHLEGVKAHLPGGARRSGAQADRIAKNIIKKSGFPAYPHSLGHGVGLDIHESPRLTIKKDAVLKPGMVVSIEPGIYEEGSYGIRIEDLVFLKKDGVDVFSQTSKLLTVL